jgi:formate hydrogenlyase subunit 3/multisubunit Na+/H+ antiporter MnhD subunit
MDLLIFLYVPAIAAAVSLIIPRKFKYFRETIAVAGSLIFLKYALETFTVDDQILSIPWFQLSVINFSLDFRLYHFSRFLLVFLGLFTLLTTIYSAGYFRNKGISPLYYPAILLALSGSAAIVLANNFFILLIAWEIVTLLLFFLIAMGEGKPAAMAAGKAFAILGFTDVGLLLAVIILPIVYNTWIISELQIPLGDPFSVIIFLLMFAAAIAKAGAIPFHSWIPPTGTSGPLPAVAFLPASVDKLLGVYLFARITLDVFIFPTDSYMNDIMMILGAITIIGGVFMQIIQNELRSLLSYCAITQFGYILLGIGSGHPIGIAGGIFHMLNHAIYKSCLFFSVGAVEDRAKTTQIDQLGGLARSMPITFVACLIAALSVSGIPPLNGFVSKWMIYQALVEGKSAASMIFLVIAMFGSALTLASFLKLLYGTFLGQKTGEKSVPDSSQIYNEVPWSMYVPMLVLAFLCISFGIFANFPLKQFIAPILNMDTAGIANTISIGTAIWSPTLATSLMLIGLIVGGIIYYISRIKVREVETLFIGGENYDINSERLMPSKIFETIEKTKFLGGFLRESEKGIFDVYNITSDIGLLGVNVLKKLHDGILSTYLAWCIIGLGVICFILMVL